MSEQEKLVEIINDFFGCDAAYYGINPLDLAIHLLANGVRSVDAVEVVHGHWFLTETEYLNCSVCGKAYYTGIETWSAAMDNLKYAGGYKYCPNCGAKMDGV